MNSVSGTLGNPSLVPPTPVLIEQIEAVEGKITKIQVVNDKKGIDIIICYSQAVFRIHIILIWIRIRIRDDGSASGSEVTFDSVNRIFPIKCYARL